MKKTVLHQLKKGDKMELTEEAKLKLEKYINSFSESYMNNSKWKRVFTELLKQKETIQKCEIFDFF